MNFKKVLQVINQIADKELKPKRHRHQYQLGPGESLHNSQFKMICHICKKEKIIKRNK